MSSYPRSSTQQFSPPLPPVFQDTITREDFDRFMSQERHGYESSTPNFTIDDLARCISQPLPQHNHGSRSSRDDGPSNTDGLEAEESTVETLCSVDHILQAPGRTNMRRLHPDCVGKDIWFRRDKTGRIVKQLLKMLKSDIPHPYPTYNSLPMEVKNWWFQAFAQEFNWDPSITEMVRNDYTTQAVASFKSNLSMWKRKIKAKAPDDLPEWMKAKKTLFDGYRKMWGTEKVAKTAATNSRNRKSPRDGLGQSIHNNGAKTTERLWDELRDEAGGNEPDMLKLIELMHTNKKTGVKDKKVVQITETVRSQVNQIASQRQSQGEGPMTQAEFNAVVVRIISATYDKQGRHGLKRLVDNMHMSFPCNSNAAHKITSNCERRHLSTVSFVISNGGG
ncbi:unnamed protein product [Microthlaspi erraticum]|uniref:Uncharacterized protein n=1 Tax=Microthlaspi erraticum TaxID=1685480 RepID=A0A6D2IN38_9BRAS|nr:unnamed protein product [Microthlaspi erraticum]